MTRRVIDQSGREIAPNQPLFTTAGYAYRLVSAGQPTFPGFSVGSIVVSAVGFVDGQLVNGEPHEKPADLFAVKVTQS